jgi:PKHD-type hydroxylase
VHAWWQHFNKFVNPQEAAQLVNYCLRRPKVAATVGHGGTAMVNQEHRRSTLRWLDPAAPELAWLVARIEHKVLQANRNAFGFDVAGFPDLQFAEYHAESADHFGWHIDNCWVPDADKRLPFTRKLSFACLLSDANTYEGGRFEADLTGGQALRAECMTQLGDALVFPSFLRHRVTPVSRGVRYSLVTWIEGPQWR